MIHTSLSEIIVSYFLKKFVEVFRDLNVNYSSQNEIARQNTIISSEEEKYSNRVLHPIYSFQMEKSKNRVAIDREAKKGKKEIYLSIHACIRSVR